jgi:hypothetical protein
VRVLAMVKYATLEKRPPLEIDGTPWSTGRRDRPSASSGCLAGGRARAILPRGPRSARRRKKPRRTSNQRRGREHPRERAALARGAPGRRRRTRRTRASHPRCSGSSYGAPRGVRVVAEVFRAGDERRAPYRALGGRTGDARALPSATSREDLADTSLALRRSGGRVGRDLAGGEPLAAGAGCATARSWAEPTRRVSLTIEATPGAPRRIHSRTRSRSADATR